MADLNSLWYTLSDAKFIPLSVWKGIIAKWLNRQDFLSLKNNPNYSAIIAKMETSSTPQIGNIWFKTQSPTPATVAAPPTITSSVPSENRTLPATDTELGNFLNPKSQWEEIVEWFWKTVDAIWDSLWKGMWFLWKKVSDTYDLVEDSVTKNPENLEKYGNLNQSFEDIHNNTTADGIKLYIVNKQKKDPNYDMMDFINEFDVNKVDWLVQIKKKNKPVK